MVVTSDNTSRHETHRVRQLVNPGYSRVRAQGTTRQWYRRFMSDQPRIAMLIKMEGVVRRAARPFLRREFDRWTNERLLSIQEAASAGDQAPLCAFVKSLRRQPPRVPGMTLASCLTNDGKVAPSPQERASTCQTKFKGEFDDRALELATAEVGSKLQASDVEITLSDAQGGRRSLCPATLRPLPQGRESSQGTLAVEGWQDDGCPKEASAARSRQQQGHSHLGRHGKGNSRWLRSKVHPYFELNDPPRKLEEELRSRLSSAPTLCAFV